ncbi:MAG: hypothetical protein QW677_10855 [Pyrobaculum sp.]
MDVAPTPNFLSSKYGIGKEFVYMPLSNYAKSGACGREKRFLSDINTSAVSTAGHFDEFARVYETFWIKGVF